LHPSSDQLGFSRFIFWGVLGPSSYLLRLVPFRSQGLSSSRVMVPSSSCVFPFMSYSSPLVLFCVYVSYFRIKDMLCFPVRFSCKLKVVRL
jgi:hypothetical protein